MNDLDIKLKKIIIEDSRKEISENDIIDNSDLVTDFGFDSIQIIEMIVDLEALFDIFIDDEDLELDVLTKYGSLKELIYKKTNN